MDGGYMEVKEVFNSKEELSAYLKWWQEKLFLTGWIIKAVICEPQDFIKSDCMGENEADYVNKCCIIRILDKKYYGNRIMKYCAEKVLVHELLHCKHNIIENKNSYEGTYFDVIEHGLLEEMAKSLIMAKYNLTLDYFDNVG